MLAKSINYRNRLEWSNKSLKFAKMHFDIFPEEERFRTQKTMFPFASEHEKSFNSLLAYMIYILL